MASKVTHFLLLSIFFCIFGAKANSDCLPRRTEYGLVCVCTASYCDYLENPQPASNEAVLISSSKEGLRFAVSNLSFSVEKTNVNTELTLNTTNEELHRSAVIVDSGQVFAQLLIDAGERLTSRFSSSSSLKLQVNRSIEYQKITGFGGAFTGSVSYLLGQLGQDLQDHIYKSFYHKDGIGFNLLRTPIGGSDFDHAPWAYNEEPRNDPKLSNFTKLDSRDEIKVQQMQRLKLVADLENLKIIAAAWSSPPWMKSNERWSGLGVLKLEYYQTWADYHLRFIELMDAKNMPIWAISTGNEPLNGVFFSHFVHFMSLGWIPQNQAVWLNDYLGPTIRKSKFKDVLIFGNDDQRYSFPVWFDKMNRSRPGVLDYLDGLAVHWYWDAIFPPSQIDLTVQRLPGKIVLNTESCIGDKPWQTHGPELGSWERGEMYALDFLHNLQHSYNGWIDWNIVLDEKGGPTYIQNTVDAPVIVNDTNHAEIYKQPIFYAIGHFSKFVPEGSVRIEAKIRSALVEAVAFKRPDERIALVLLNRDSVPVEVLLSDTVRGEIAIDVPANSWHTIVYN
ncbi:lysosomal acid glucosylceramidase-like isoform X1 [Anastrepha obliqua]|uniref:lysosomal acid glucosylceramidase-like isoform X1 n=1 Tax=Anastrepha obliqua TaxID=95512 RepID=UPI00240A457F|nr:lysosomal acid glucosylceramidase-like isoform X1 [Anastrepha obliqua]